MDCPGWWATVGSVRLVLPGRSRSLSSGTDKERPARTKNPPGHGRCSFAIRRGKPASSTLPPADGSMQGLSLVRSTLTAAAPWPVTGPMSARRRRVRGLLAGIVRRVTRRSACCRTAWRRACRGRWTSWRRLWLRPRRRAAWRRRRTRCARVVSRIRSIEAQAIFPH